MTRIEPGVFDEPFQGSISVPGSKSLTNRILPLAALSGKKVRIDGALKSEDTEVMISALRQLGVKIECGLENGSNYEHLIVQGTSGKFSASGDIELDCQNSGTTLRFIAALAALRNGQTVLTGNKRMQERPIHDLVEALRQIGIIVEYLNQEGFPPLAISLEKIPAVFEVEVSGKVSSQFLSALIMLGVFLEKGADIRISGGLVSSEYVQMTIRLLEEFEARIEFTADRIAIAPQQLQFPNQFSVEGDATATTYPLAIAAVTGGKIIVQNLYSNSLQGDIKFAEIVLQKMGCKMEFNSNCLSVSGPDDLQPLGTVNLEQMPDAAMTAVVLAAYAKGFSRIEGLSTLQHKESERITALAQNLRKMGAEVRFGADFIEIEGDPEKLHGAEIETFDDHRIAMCFSVLASVVPGVIILNPECVAKTYPTYWEEYGKWKNRSSGYPLTRSPSSPLTRGARGVTKPPKEKYLSYNPTLTHHARSNRKNPTPMEARLWYEVLSGNKTGYKFLRQKPIQDFIVDFYCSKLKLAIELDGDSHSEQQAYDSQRTAALNSLEIKVIRYWNNDVMTSLEGVFDNLMEQIHQREEELQTNPLNPPYQGDLSGHPELGSGSEFLRMPEIPDQVRDDKMNIVFIGMRGSGKSTLGRLYAEELGMDFVDTDDEIEKLAGKTIPEIVNEKGWDYFRELERQVCAAVSKRENTVIAVGGGAVMDAGNVKSLKKNGFVIFLWAPLEILVERLSTPENKRPALKSGKVLKEEMEEIWEERRNIYFEAADLMWKSKVDLAVRLLIRTINYKVQE